MKIALFVQEEWEKQFLSEKLHEHDLVFFNGTLQEHKDYRDDAVECLCIFIKSRVDVEVLDRFPSLKGVVTRSTGFDHIDVEEAKRRGIVVSNVPAYGENTVAEYAFAMLLTLSRRIYETYDRVLEEGTYSTEGLTGFDLRGKKIGIVGTGHTGEHAIRIAKGFGMDVIAYDVHERHELAHELGFMYVVFEDLIAQSDVISLHAPYNEQTHHMINMSHTHTFKKGAYLINTARGALIETRALVAMLEDGVLAGAALDVVEEEGKMANISTLLTDEHPDAHQLQILLTNHYLINHPDVLVMPHNAFNTREALMRILDTTVENIEAIARGTPVHVVNG